MRLLETQDSMISYYPIMFYLFSAVCFASSLETELPSLPGCPRNCGYLTIPFPFGMSPECSFDGSFHIICDSSFEPPKPFLRLLNAEVVSISLDGKLELLNSSSSPMGLEEREGEILHMVVDWAAGDEDCHAAQRFGSRFACRSLHSQCLDSSTGRGHVCRCLPGYQGNSYLAHGCQDIDECAVSNPCEGECENLPGSFKCYCAKGLVGDGRKDGSGCDTQDQTNWSALLVVILPIGIFVIAPILAVTHSDPGKGRKNKLDEKEMDNFKKHGGDLLERKKKKKKLELEIYSTQRMNSISKFLPEIKTFRYNSGVKFYSGALSPTADTNTNNEVVQTIAGVPKGKIEDFVDQLIFLSKTHPNLVRVLGCCLEMDSPVIVYERHGNGNTTLLDCTRSGSDLAANFSCEMRLEAARGVATGLEDFYQLKTFLHGDICSANIMMDTTSYKPKIFYAAGSNLVTRDPNQEKDSYTDPEDLNEKSDVYSFGAVLVELLTGGRSSESELPKSIEKAQANRLLEILDQQMKDQGDVVNMAAALAHRCLNVIPKERPTMKEVSDELHGRRTERPGLFSRLFHCSTVR